MAGAGRGAVGRGGAGRGFSLSLALSQFIRSFPSLENGLFLREIF